MKDIKTLKMISIATIMCENNYEKNDIVERRINNYDFSVSTRITHTDKHIKISTETSIKGVHNVLYLFSNGMSKVDFEFS